MEILAPTTSVWPYFGWALTCCLVGASIGAALLSISDDGASDGFPPLMTAFFSGAIGFSVLGTSLFALVLVERITPLNTVLLICGVFAASLTMSLLADLKNRVPLAYGLRRQLRRLTPATAADFLSLAVLGFLLLYLTFESVQVPGQWDDTSYHLPVARHYINSDASQINTWLRFPLFPHLANLFFSAAINLGGEIGAEIVANAVPMTLTAAGIIGLVQWRTASATWGWLAMSFWLSFPLLADNLGFAYVDHWLTLFSWAATAATVVAISESGDMKSSSWLVMIGVLTGAAASTKIFGALWACMIAILLAIRFGVKSKSFLLFTAFAAITGTGWYIRSFILSGDPIHPAGGGIFGHYLWNAADLNSQASEQSFHRHGLLWFDTLSGLQRAALMPVCLSLLALFIREQRFKVDAWLSGTLAAYIFLWFSLFPPPRYTLQILPLASYLSIASIALISIKLIQKSRIKTQQPAKRLIFLLVFALTVTLEFKYIRLAHKNFSYRVQHWEEILHERPGFLAMKSAFELNDQRHGSATLIQLGFENAVYFYPGTAIGDWFGPGRYSQFLECTNSCRVTNAENLSILMKRFSSKIAVVNGARFEFNQNDYTNKFFVKQVAPQQFMLWPKPD
ncbi:hypothetical protein EYS42_03780 [Aquabacterium lacunae]|uniref:Glycosyltransferase RgtA/B/C/D-like domain-containing protein n=1 Tax=Aquabacterium lacunae TaxID=2528630 RepID=A0A4V2JG38_9BURK|nr:hypothetical protein [Aquabacterium lacunae]TBO34536.1 hypothetical protein EYS42_03780 [Aquabacterium lacunae]